MGAFKWQWYETLKTVLKVTGRLSTDPLVLDLLEEAVEYRDLMSRDEVEEFVRAKYEKKMREATK